MQTALETKVQGLEPAFAVDQAANAWSTTFTWSQDPKNVPNGVLAFGEGGFIADTLELVPFGVGAAGATFDVQVDRVDHVRLQGALPGDGVIHVARPCLRFTATLGTTAGLSGTPVDATHLFATTVSDPAANYGTLGVDCQKVSPGDGPPASYFVATKGARIVRVQVRLGTATAANVLVKGLS